MQRTVCLFFFYFAQQKISSHSVGLVNLLSFPSLKSSDSTVVMQELRRVFLSCITNFTIWVRVFFLKYCGKWTFSKKPGNSNLPSLRFFPSASRPAPPAPSCHIGNTEQSRWGREAVELASWGLRRGAEPLRQAQGEPVLSFPMWRTYVGFRPSKRLGVEEFENEGQET